MSDGMHPASDGMEAPELWAPDWGDRLNMGERFMLVMLERWADGRGALRGTIEEFARRMRIGTSTARGYLSTLVREGYVSRPARGRLEDGTLTPYCHWLNLEKLSRPDIHRQNSAVDETGAEPVSPAVGKGDEPPPELSSDHRQNSASSAETQQPPPELSGGETGGDITTGARAGAQARAAFPFPSYSHFLSFPWRDDDTKEKAELILKACGEGLGQLGAQGNRVLNSLAYVLDGLWADFDLALDVLPVVRRKTGPGRKSPLWDFALLFENLEKHKAKRLREAARSEGGLSAFAPAGAAKPSAAKGRTQGERGFAAPSANDAAKRASRIIGHRNVIRAYDDGDRSMTYLLTPDERRLDGEWREDAFAALIARYRSELADMLAVEGGGDGSGGNG